MSLLAIPWAIVSHSLLSAERQNAAAGIIGVLAPHRGLAERLTRSVDTWELPRDRSGGHALGAGRR